MRNQRQSFYRFKPAVNLLAFAVMMAANSNLPAADDPVPYPPEGVHFQFVVPVNLTNLDSKVKRVDLSCSIGYGPNTFAGLGSGQASIPVDAAGRAVQRVIMAIVVQAQNLQHLNSASGWLCKLYAVDDSGRAGTEFRIPTGPGTGHFAALRTGSPAADVGGGTKVLQAKGNVR